MEHAAAQGKLAANASLLASATAASRVLGFVRDLGMAALLGGGPVADAFFLAFRIPDLMRRVVGEGVSSMALVPAFRHCSHTAADGWQRSFALARSLLAWVVLLVGGACALCLVFAPELLSVLTPGIVHTPATLQQAAGLLRICVPYGLLVIAAALSMALLNALGHFLAPALAPAALNCVLLLAVLCSLLFGVAGLQAAHVLAWSVLAGGAAQFLVQQRALAARGFSWRGPFRLRDPEARSLGRSIAPVLVGVSGFQISGLLATLAAASMQQGSVSWLYFAERLAQLPLGLFSVAVSLAALPELTSLASQGRRREFDQVLSRSLGLVLWCSVPAAAGLAGLAGPLVSLLFGHGAFAGPAVQGTAAMLAALAPGLPAFALVRPLAAAANARQDSATPFRAALAGLLCFGLAAWPCMVHLQAPGLALAMSAGGWCNAAALLFALRRQGVRLAAGLRAPCLTVMLGLLVYALSRFGASLAGEGWSWLAVVVLVPGLVLGYVLASLALKLSPAWLLRETLLRALGRKGHPGTG